MSDSELLPYDDSMDKTPCWEFDEEYPQPYLSDNPLDFDGCPAQCVECGKFFEPEDAAAFDEEGNGYCTECVDPLPLLM